MDELKNIVVSATQGGLDLDSDLHAIADGDGRDRRNVMIYENGRVDKSKGFTNIYNPSGSPDYDVISSCADEVGNVYVLTHSSGTFRIYKDNVKVFESKDALFDPTEYVQFEAHDGYWFITQEGYEPLMIDTSRPLLKEYVIKSQRVYYDSPYDTIEFILGYYDVLYLREGDTISFIPSAKGLANGAMYYTGVIDTILLDYPFAYIYCTTDARKYTTISGDCGVLVKGEYKYANLYENLTTIKPIPLKAPEVEMLSDSSLGYNNFVENTYVFGYTVVYDDDYETPMSPLSVVNLESLSVSSIQRSNVNAYNKARIYIVPPPTAKKVKLFVKKNSESESFYRISTNDFENEIAVLWDGSLAADVYSNDEWAKGFESVPQSAKTFGYLSDDRIVYGGCTEGYNCDEPKIFASYTTTEYDADISRTIIPSYTYTGTGFRDGVYLEFITKLGFSSATIVGSFKFESTCMANVGETWSRKIVLSVTVDIEIGDSPTDILYKIIDEINIRYNDSSLSNKDRVLAQEYPFGKINLSMNQIGYEIYHATAKMDYYFGNLVFAKTQKTGYEEQYGVVWKDRAGRSSGVFTNESCKVTFPEYDATERIITSKPIIYLNATPPSWATCYQFVVKRNLKSWSQHIVPCKGTDGSWGETDSLAIKKFANDIYGIALNRIIDPGVENGANQLVYQYKEGDYIRLIRTYTPTGWVNNPNSKMFRITGTKVDPYTYSVIDDTDDNFADIFTAYESASNTYLQFEVVNVGDISLTSDNVWNEIGESYGLIGVYGYGQREGDTYEYPEDGQSYFFYEHEVDYGRAVARPVYRANLDLDDYVEWIFYVESEYIFDGSNKKLLITGRPHTITDNTQRFRNIIRNGGRKFDGTEIDNRRVFDYLDYSDLGENYGEISGLVQRGNTVRVYCPRKSGSIYLNANEMSNQDGTTNLIYNSKVLGTLRWSNQKYGCTDARSIFSTGDDICFFDSINKKFIKDTQGGMFCISSKDQQYDGKVDSFFKSITGDVIVGYDPIYRVVYVTADDTIAFLEDYGRWFTFFDIEPLGYFVAVNKLYSYNTYGVFEHNTQGLVSYNSLGIQSDADGELDLVIAPERINGKNYEAVVLHSESKRNVYLNCYTKNWSDDLYTKIPSGTFKEWDGMYYADVTKGGKESTFKSYMMYAGNDMVGKVGIFKVVGDVSLSGLEVRYSIRNR